MFHLLLLHFVTAGVPIKAVREARDVTRQWIQYQGHVTVTHTPRPRHLQPATQQSHFSNRWEQEFHFRHALYFIYHISSIHLMLPIAGFYGLNTAQHFLECWRCSFLIIHDNCSNISLPAWFHMAQHRIQSNKCACVGTNQFKETVRKFSESKTRLWTATKWKDKTVSHSTYRKTTPAFTAW